MAQIFTDIWRKPLAAGVMQAACTSVNLGLGLGVSQFHTANPVELERIELREQLCPSERNDHWPKSSPRSLTLNGPWRRRRLFNDVIAALWDVQLLSHYSENRAMHLLRWPAGKSERSAQRATCLQPSSEVAQAASCCLEIFEHHWNWP